MTEHALLPAHAGGAFADGAATLLIDGGWTATADTFPVVNPATLEVIGHAADAGPHQAAATLDAACAASPGWRAETAEARSGHLRAAAAALRDAVDDLAARLTAENGKPLFEARGEVLNCARMLEWSAEEARRVDGRVTPPTAAGPGLILKAPVGPVLAISPWNFPASMAVRKVGLALAAGCPIILKPAEQTPLIAAAIARLIDGVGLPPGVLQVLTTSRPGPLVDRLLVDDRLRKVSFTGSTEIGLSLVRRTDDTLRRLSLEMGGHAPAIVFADADLDAAADAVTAAKFANAGQSCIAINRLYVHASIHDDFVARLEQRAAALTVGAGADADTRIGPLIDHATLDKVERHVADAVDRGARVVLGGRRAAEDRPELCGAFYAPTLLVDVDEEMLVTREETFGPVLPVLRFEHDDEAIDAANESAYGLAAYVFGADFARIWSALDHLDFGVIGVNEAAIVRPELPFGGLRNSGQEREGGAEGIEAYLETKAVAVRLAGRRGRAR